MMIMRSAVYAVLIIGTMEWCQSLYRDPVSVNCVQFTPDTRRVIAGMANGSISVCIITLAPFSRKQKRIGRLSNCPSVLSVCLSVCPIFLSKRLSADAVS